MKPGLALIIGASSGIGRELVRQLAEQGWKVAAVARRLDRLEELVHEFPDKVKAYTHDVNNHGEIPELFQQIAHDLGGLDLVVYSSGVLSSVGPMEFSFEKDKPMIDVNVTGAVAWLNEAAIRFQGTRHGSIVGIGSVAGDRGRKGQPVYNASKAFLHSYLESLRNRLHGYGVCVVTIKPGPVDTEMIASLKLHGTMPVQDAVRKIVQVLDKPGEHYLKVTHWVAFGIIKRIPGFIFRRLGI